MPTTSLTQAAPQIYTFIVANCEYKYLVSACAWNEQQARNIFSGLSLVFIKRLPA